MNRAAVTALSEELVKAARENLERDRELVHVVILILTGGVSIPIVIVGEDRELDVKLIGDMADQLGAVAAVEIADGWMKRFDKADDVGGLRDYRGPRISQLPDRREAVVVARAGFGWCESVIYPYRRDGDQITWETADISWGRWCPSEARLLTYFLARGQ